MPKGTVAPGNVCPSGPVPMNGSTKDTGETVCAGRIDPQKQRTPKRKRDFQRVHIARLCSIETVFQIWHVRSSAIEAAPQNDLSIRSYHISGMRFFSRVLCLLQLLKPGTGR